MKLIFRVGELRPYSQTFNGSHHRSMFDVLELDKRFLSKAGATRSLKRWIKWDQRLYGRSRTIEESTMSVQALCMKFDTQRNSWVEVDSAILAAKDWLNTKHRDEVLDKLGCRLVNPHIHEARMRQKQQHEE